jgi:tripartite-type tricarboxylate transporter receptor subunit TctC
MFKKVSAQRKNSSSEPDFATRARLAAAAVMFTMAGSASVAQAAMTAAQVQAYPSKPIRFIVPFSPGGAGDTIMRVVGQKLTEAWGQSAIIDNRAGASGAIGLQMAAKSAPDGYTLVHGTASTHTINPILQHDLPYDAVRDFAPVAILMAIPNIIVAHPAVPVSNLKELIQLAKSKPGQISYASNGTGTASHMAGELLNLEAGIKLVHIPYKGAGPAIIDVLGGHVQLLIGAVATSLPHVTSGKLKALAVTSLQRSAAAPAVPTVAESGLPGFEVVQWFAIYAPAKTPQEIVAKLNAEINRALNQPNVKNEFTRQGYDVDNRTPEQFAAYMKEETVKWTRLIKAAGIHAD